MFLSRFASRASEPTPVRLPPRVRRFGSSAHTICGDPAFKRLLPGASYEPVNRKWEVAEFEHRLHGWPQARRFVVARRFIQKEEAFPAN
jgi:hypothetical protein